MRALRGLGGVVRLLVFLYFCSVGSQWLYHNVMEQEYIVSARKYRPSTFHSVVGQKALTATLKNAIDSSRLAQAYLFCGPRGVGKTSCARIFAKTINCLNKTAEGEACNECESCRAFNEGRSMNIVELDAASNNSVDDIRALNDQVRIPPQIGSYRVFIIDEVHMLSVAAFNAFLKTLEEPPKYVVFILATTEKHKVIPTILSRCQIYDFNRITVDDMVEHLKYVASQEGITTEDAALNVIAQKADGAMRDALSIFDQVAASSRGNITYRSTIENLNVLDYEYYFRLVDAFMAGDVEQSLLIYKEVRDAGFDSLFFVNGLGNHVRDLMVAASPATVGLLEVSSDVAQRYVAQAAGVSPQWFYGAMEYVNFCDLNYRAASNKQMIVELTLIRLCQLSGGNPNRIDAAKPQVAMQPMQQPTKSAAAAQASAPTHTASVTPTHAASATPAQQPAQQAAAPVQQPAAQASAAQPAPAATKPNHAAPAYAPPRRSTVKVPISTIRINNASAPADEQAANGSNAPVATSQPVGSAQRAAPFKFEALMGAWQEFMENHTDEKLLYNTMRASTPTATSEQFVYEVKVDNPAQQERLSEHMGELLRWLRDKVANDSVKIQLTLTPPTEMPKVLTPAEHLKKMVEANPVIGNILSSLDMELAR